ncbi:hypothetical protein [Streptomyces sp. NBC_00566]|uniref:hypothetical protein n=1 Tax=Streptomyces sp. NBC_00566 TaxID=2975778 RepID=UPI002E80358A|nr:hypothetical protein [Streptomyces sp. NBC_00566]WUB86467.1 hypothetical protein OG812_07655 [Streptomyces sp. NBC_00566]
MPRSLRSATVSITLLGAISACSGGIQAENEGVKANEVCGKFAHTTSVASALARLTGTERLSEDGSEPEKALAALRDADGKVEDSEMQGVPKCLLRPPTGGNQLVTIYFREAVVILKANPESEKTNTYYRTGASASASHRWATIYFHCHMTKPAKDVIINASLERESSIKLSGKREAEDQMLVVNAAAQGVARQLGCQGTNLTSGGPQAISGVYASH